MRYENKLAFERCPFCGAQRSADWFGPELRADVRDEKTGKVKRVIRYRKYVGCWRCRELRGHRGLRMPPVSEAL